MHKTQIQGLSRLLLRESSKYESSIRIGITQKHTKICDLRSHLALFSLIYVSFSPRTIGYRQAYFNWKNLRSRSNNGAGVEGGREGVRYVYT